LFESGFTGFSGFSGFLGFLGFLGFFRIFQNKYLIVLCQIQNLLIFMVFEKGNFL
jgi:hypothetical protein